MGKGREYRYGIGVEGYVDSMDLDDGVLRGSSVRRCHRGVDVAAAPVETGLSPVFNKIATGLCWISCRFVSLCVDLMSYVVIARDLLQNVPKFVFRRVTIQN